jgi:hypothetical protein
VRFQKRRFTQPKHPTIKEIVDEPDAKVYLEQNFK